MGKLGVTLAGHAPGRGLAGDAGAKLDRELLMLRWLSRWLVREAGWDAVALEERRGPAVGRREKRGEREIGRGELNKRREASAGGVVVCWCRCWFSSLVGCSIWDWSCRVVFCFQIWVRHPVDAQQCQRGTLGSPSAAHWRSLLKGLKSKIRWLVVWGRG